MWQGFVNSSLLHTLSLNPKPKSHLGCEYCREKRYPILKFLKQPFQKAFGFLYQKGLKRKRSQVLKNFLESFGKLSDPYTQGLYFHKLSNSTLPEEI